MPFGLHAVSREDPAGSSVEEGTVQVGAFMDPFAELVPRTSRGSRSGSHDLAVDNRGNVRLNAEVEAADADRLLEFDVNPPGVVVEPGMAQFAKLKVKPTKRFWRGSPKTRPFQLVVRSEGSPPVTLDGAILQEAVLPPWFARAIVALIALVIVLIILWLFVLKPSIQSAASEAVASAAGRPQDDVNKALSRTAGLATWARGEGGAASPTPAPTCGIERRRGWLRRASDPAPTPGGPFIPGLGNPVDGRLVQGSAAGRSGGHAVPDRPRLLEPERPRGRPRPHPRWKAAVRDAARELPRHRLPLRDPDRRRRRSRARALPLVHWWRTTCDPSVLYSGYLRP